MELALELFNLNTSRKIIKAIFFFVGLSFFMSFSGIEKTFEVGQLKVVSSANFYCLAGELTEGAKDSDQSLELFVALGTTGLEDKKTFAFVARPLLSSKLTFEKHLQGSSIFTASSVFDFSRPGRAPPQA